MINKEEYIVFLRHLPRKFRKSFKAFGSSFNISEALYLIHKNDLKPSDISVKDTAKTYDLDGPEDRTGMYFNIWSTITDNDVFAANVDLNIPLIFVRTLDMTGDEVALLIDGYKRLRRAFLEKRTSIPAYFLSQEMTKEIMTNEY